MKTTKRNVIKGYRSKLLLALVLTGMCHDHGLRAETLDEFCSTLGRGEFSVPSENEMTNKSLKKDAEGKAYKFLNQGEVNNPSIVLFRRLGLFAQESPTKKQLNVNFSKYHCYYCPQENPGEAITVDLRPIIMPGNRADGKLKCAVFVLGNAQLAPDECDDGPVGALRVRSLPLGVLKSSFKNADRDGMKVKIVPVYPKESHKRGRFWIMTYTPGLSPESPKCCVIENWILNRDDAEVLSICIQDSELKDEYRKQLRECSLFTSLDGIFEEMRKDLRTKGLLVVKLSTSGCPKWNSFLQDLHSARLDEHNTAEWVAKLQSLETTGTYLYASNPDRACDGCWYDGTGALSLALFLSDGLLKRDVDNLRRAYIMLAAEKNASPEDIHRTLTLYLSMAPYRVYDFFQGLQNDNGERFVYNFFKKYRLDDIVGSFGDSAEELIGLCQAQVDAERGEEMTRRGDGGFKRWFEQWKNAILQQKDRLPPYRLQPHGPLFRINDLYPLSLYPELQVSGDVPDTTFRRLVKSAIDEAQHLFVEDVSSHVLWSRCLWQAIPLETALTLLEPYWPKSGVTVGAVMAQIMRDFVDSGLFDCTLTEGVMLNEKMRKESSIVRTARGDYGMTVDGDGLNDEQAKDWLISGYGGYVKIMGNSSRDKARAMCRSFLNRLVKNDLILPGMSLTYALGRFLDAARQNPNGPEFLAIQRATGVEDFKKFESSVWNLFVWQVIDNVVAMGRCRDGTYGAMKTGLPHIMRPKDPENLSAFYWFAEKSLQEYHGKFLDIFDSHLRSYDDHNRPDIEERTYGKPWLVWKVGPVFGFTPESNPEYLLGIYDEGRDPVVDCLQPFVTGTFGDARYSAKELFPSGSPSIFLSAGHKKNTTKRPTGEFEFTYIMPFSPVSVLYHDMRDLFARRLALDIDKETISPVELRAWGELMQVLFLKKEIRDEYHNFIAPIDPEPVTNEQLALWTLGMSEMPRIPLSFRAIRALNGNSEAISQLNQRLRYWKIDMHLGRFYFYPSFDAAKYVAVTLGYARGELSGLQSKQLEPDFTPDHQKPSASHKGFYKHFNIWRERIDIKPENSDSENPRSSHHPYNEGDLIQRPEPSAFQKSYSIREMAVHADATQKLFYGVLLFNGVELLHLLEREQELATIKKDLKRWNELAQQSENADLPAEEASELEALLKKYPGVDIDKLRSHIASLEIGWCDMKLRLNSRRSDGALYERLKTANQDLMRSETGAQLAVVEAKLAIANHDRDRLRVLLVEQRKRSLQSSEIGELEELQSRYGTNVHVVTGNLERKLRALRIGEADDGEDAFFWLEE